MRRATRLFGATLNLGLAIRRGPSSWFDIDGWPRPHRAHVVSLVSNLIRVSILAKASHASQSMSTLRKRGGNVTFSVERREIPKIG